MHTPHNTGEHTHVKTFASILESQLSQGDPNAEIVDQQYINLAYYASKEEKRHHNTCGTTHTILNGVGCK